MAKTKKSDVGLQTEITNSNYQNYLEKIKSGVDGVMSNYILIGYYLNQLLHDDLFKEGHYDSIFQLGMSEFNLSETTIKNSMGVANKYCDNQGNLKDEFKEFKFSALVELLPVESEKVLVEFHPEMTVKEIRDKKKSTKPKEQQMTIDDIEDHEIVEETEEFNDNELINLDYVPLNMDSIKNIHPSIYHFLAMFISQDESNLFIKVVNKIEMILYLDSIKSDDNPEYLIIKYINNELCIDCIDKEIEASLKDYLSSFNSFRFYLHNLFDLQNGK